MGKLESTRHFSRLAVESLLEDRYGSLRKWATQLTHGDAGAAQDIVHDLCLHFVVSRPDMSGVTNVDGYLYTCLRHIYLSSIARAAREATQFVSVADFDSIHTALNSLSRDDLADSQNDLRRICSYAVWRKATSKSASYFVLHFFHGYARREIAEIARLPISAIYNKLKIARTEVKAHLESAERLRIATRDIPSAPELRAGAVSSMELFDELRRLIFAARTTECIPEESLLALYAASPPRPIQCALLSHIVSCEQCLAVIDKHLQRPTLDQRDGIEETTSSLDGGTDDKSSFRALMRSVRKERDRIYEHRPQKISIAINGRINATHNIQGEWSTLSTRLDAPETIRFIEVFTDQRMRVALLPVDERPPEGPHTKTQRVVLSDDRWLELTLSFDGLGLESEVIYFDPALATSAQREEDPDENLATPADDGVNRLRAAEKQRQGVNGPISGVLAWIVRVFSPRPAIAWAAPLLLVLLATIGYVAYRHAKPVDGAALLAQSVHVETANLAGETEHQILHVEINAAGGRPPQNATIDIWRDGDGKRYARRVYDAHQQLIAAEWRTNSGELHSWSSQAVGDLSESSYPVLQSDLWRLDLSSRGFRSLSDHELHVQKTDDGYEVTMTGPTRNQPHLVSTTLILDHKLHPVRELVRVRNRSGIDEARFVETDYELRPSASIPDTTFVSGFEGRLAGPDGISHSGSPSGHPSWPPSDEIRLTELEIAVLYQLNQIGADAGEPIQVSRTAEGHVRVVGAVADDARRRQIASLLQALNDRQLLDVHLVAQTAGRPPVIQSFHELPGATSVYSVGNARIPADAIMRQHLASKGIAPERMDRAVAQLSNRIMETSQRALQNAYVLDRLGMVLAQAESSSISRPAQQQWTEMVAKHSSELQNALNSLSEQVSSIHPVGERHSSQEQAALTINDPAGFARATHVLLRQVQEINHNVGVACAYSPSEGSSGNMEQLLESTVQAIPSREAKALGETAERLSASARPSAAQR